MKYLAIIVAIGMAVFTGLSIAFADTWAYRTVVYLGSHSVSTFDLVFFSAALLLLVANAIRIRPEWVPANRLVLGLCWFYVGYQLFVVLPAAVLLHDLRPIDVFRLQQVRLALILVPLTYGVVLRYWKPDVLVGIVDAVAAALGLWVLYRYATHGAHGYVESGVFRLRQVWGGSILLFGWLLLTSLFYWPTRVWRLALAGLALAGIGLANERSGILACLVSFLTLLVVMRGVTRRALLAFALVVAVSLGVYAASPPSVRQSVGYSLATTFNPSSDQTAQDRVIRSTLGLAYFAQHPLGDYVWSRTFYAVNLGAATFVPHNFVVQLLVTQGVIAAGLYFAIIAITIFIAWRNRRDRLSALMLAYLVFYLSFNLLNANIDLPENIALFCIAIGIVLYQNQAMSRPAQGRLPLGDDAKAQGVDSASDPGLVKDAALRVPR